MNAISQPVLAWQIIGFPTAAAGLIFPQMEPFPQEAIDHDCKLLELIAAGDQAAFSEFYDRHSSMVYSFVAGMLKSAAESDDVFQAILLQVWDNASKYTAEKGRPATWLLTIARNKTIDHIRSRRRRCQAVDAMAEEVKSGNADYPADSVWFEIDDKEKAAEIRDALNGLRPEYREVLELAYFSGLTQMEISGALGEPLGTVKARARRGMLQLRDKLNHLL